LPLVILSSGLIENADAAELQSCCSLAKDRRDRYWMLHDNGFGE
jgi:hypothetical protein